MKRILYFDIIRVFLTVLVIYHHSAIAFGASGGWYYISKETASGLTQQLLSANMAIDQSFCMSLFFFISAYLMAISFDHKGTKAFIRDRLNRLGIPLLIYYFLFDPLLNYWIYGIWGKPGLGPMWFVFTLLIFEFCYICYRHFCGKQLHITCKFPRITTLIGFMLITGALAFTIRLYIPVGQDIFGLQLGFFALYIGMYLGGILAYRNQWLKQLELKNTRFWLIVVILSTIFLLYVILSSPPTEEFAGGWNAQALFYAFWEPFMCVGISCLILTYGKFYFNYSSPSIQKLSRNSYAAYIIHPLIVVGCTLGADFLPGSPLIRLGLVCITGIPLCFIFGAGFRRVLNKLHINI